MNRVTACAAIQKAINLLMSRLSKLGKKEVFDWDDVVNVHSYVDRLLKLIEAQDKLECV